MLLALTGTVAVGQMYVVLGMVDAMSHDLKVDVSVGATATTVFGAAYAVGFVLSGPLASRFGAHRVLITGLLGSAAAAVAAGLPTTFEGELAVRVVQGAMTATFAPCALVWIAQQMPSRARTQAATALTGSFFASATLLPLIAAPVAEAWGWRSVFFASGVALVLASLALAVVLRSNAEVPSIPLNTAWRQLGRVLQRGPVVLVLFATTAVLSTYVAMFTMLERFRPEAVAAFPGGMQGLRGLSLIAVFAATAGAGGLGAISARTRAVGGFTVIAIAVAAIGYAPSSVVLALAVAVFVAAVASTAPAVLQCLVQASGASQSAAATGWYGAFTFLGGSAGSLLPDVVSTETGATWLLVGLALGGAGLVGAARGARVRRGLPEEHAAG